MNIDRFTLPSHRDILFQILNIGSQFTRTIIKEVNITSRVYKMVKRSRLEVYFNVLEVIEHGTEKPTRIMYKTNLCWTSLHEALDTLLNSGFIKAEQKKKSKRYRITRKGKNALSYHKKSLEGLRPHQHPNLL